MKTKRTVYFVIPLANIDESAVGLELETDFVIEKWPMAKLVAVESHFSAEVSDEFVTEVEYACCLNVGADNVYVICGEVDGDEYWQPIPKNANFIEKWFDRGRYIARINEKIKLMRLFKEGQIETKGSYVYEKKGKKIEPILSSGLGVAPHKDIPYTLTVSEKDELGQFLKKYTTPLKPEFLQLAFENLDQSYSVEHDELAFLTLMIGVEVIFNDGKQELKYRITRGMAILLGTLYSPREIYDKMRKLYDMRSRLVHTARHDDLVFHDILGLRFLLRTAILKLMDLQISKDKLSELLTISGFGDDITKKVKPTK